jgi:hypothetical protein
MAGVLVLLLAAGAGWLAVSASGTCRGLRPRWAAFLLEGTFGVAAGLGTVSTLFFALQWAGLGARPAAWAAFLLPAAAAIAFYYLRRSTTAPEFPAPPEWRWSGLCAAAFALALVLFLAGFSTAANANPQGDWDAWAIWNLRARFLAGSGTWHNAVSPELSRTHPEYPLLWSGVIGQAWAATGDAGNPAVPIAAAVLISVAAPLLLAASLALLHSSAAGWLAALILVSTAAWWRQSQALYADVPLAFWILATLAAAALAQARGWHRPALILSGLLASLAAWTKNEGMLFIVISALALAWAARGLCIPWLAGALPVALLAAAFRLLLAPPSRLFDAGLMTDTGRAFQVLKGLTAGVAGLGPWAANPILLSVLLASAIGLRRPFKTAWLLAPPLALLAGGAAVLWGTTNDLAWQIDTTRERLLIQVLPAVLLGLFLLLRLPPQPQAAPAAEPSQPRRRK